MTPGKFIELMRQAGWPDASIPGLILAYEREGGKFTPETRNSNYYQIVEYGARWARRYDTFDEAQRIVHKVVVETPYAISTIGRYKIDEFTHDGKFVRSHSQ